MVDSVSVEETEIAETIPAQEYVLQAETQTEISTETLKETVTGTEETVSEQVEPPCVNIIMVGDILLHTPVEESALQEDGTYDFSPLFHNTKDVIASADLALVNQEVIIGGAELGISGYPCFNAPVEVGDALVDAGFDVVCHGTNHAMDKGKGGLLNCLLFWEEKYPEIAVLGIHEEEEDRNTIYVYEQDGIRIAILNYTYGTNGIALPADMPYAVALLEEEQVIQDLQRAEEMADFTIVCPHWGTEYLLGISEEQKKWTDIFLENGVDLVLGTHPHVIEPIEWIQDENTGNEMLVYYSLGNFVNWTSSSGDGIANRMVGGMADVTLSMDEKGEVFITDYGVKALVCHLEEGVNGVTTYFLSEYPDSLAVKNEIGKQDFNFSKEYCLDLCDKIWQDLWE